MRAFIFACLFCLSLPVDADGGLATVEIRTLASPLTAYAQVEAIQTLTLLDDVATDSRSVPGTVVREGRVRLPPRHALWLRAVFYGKDIVALHPGMAGVFRSATGGKPTPVTVRKVIKPLRLDGGRGVVCAPTNAEPEWFNGAVGTLQLDGPRRNWAAVPTEALILDGGRWWVLLHDARGDRKSVV